ncbi:hypothetical protein AAFN75_06240 [Algibacter sp. AS12]|uniref:hypothetical protein n=1 Tax=Algibacter sp. AS12 TaxID=3135773 RepID=UPI00398A5C88
MIINYIKKYKGFFYSLLFSIAIWFIAFLLIPAKPVESIKPVTIFFILGCYLSLVTGFLCFNFKTKPIEFKQKPRTTFYLNILLIILVLSYLLRWFDLFWIRELSFFNETIENRAIKDANSSSSGWLFVIASIIKSIYFFPFIFVKKLKLKSAGYTVILAYALLLFPWVEAILLGARKPFFEVFLIVIITYLLFKTQKIKLKPFLIICFSFFLLMSVSVVLLIKREHEVAKHKVAFFDSILKSRYNDLLKPTDEAENYFYSKDNNELIKYYALIGLHSGQYISHGVFEFNHIIDKQDLQKTNGTYTFFPIINFFNKFNISEPIVLNNPSPRSYVYLTAFGSFYIDFRWLTLLAMFIFGVFQKYAFQKSKHSIIYIPILIYLLLINVFLPITNYIRGIGIYPFVAFSFVLSLYKLIELNQKNKVS